MSIAKKLEKRVCRDFSKTAEKKWGLFFSRWKLLRKPTKTSGSQRFSRVTSRVVEKTRWDKSRVFTCFLIPEKYRAIGRAFALLVWPEFLRMFFHVSPRKAQWFWNSVVKGSHRKMRTRVFSRRFVEKHASNSDVPSRPHAQQEQQESLNLSP